MEYAVKTAEIAEYNMAMGNPTLGMTMGMSVGMCLGIAFGSAKNKK